MKILEANNIRQINWSNRKGVAAGRSKDVPAHADRVSLSDELVEKQKVDAERVETIRQAIAEGKYQFDLERLASSFMEKELL